ncbi:MAG: hypothetical protein Kow0077_10920 [Anaerolineae bacterium]
MSFFGGRRQQESNEARPAGAGSKPTTPPPPRQPVGFETVLGAHTEFKGDFHGSGNARFDGIFEGTLEIDGNILIGETAKITADINARNISIAGAVRGNVNGNKVQILRTGRVWGDINAAAITTEEGAFIDGKITMVSHEAARQPEGAPEEAPALVEPESVQEPDFMAELDAIHEAEDEPADVEDATLILDAEEMPAEADSEEAPAEAEREERRSFFGGGVMNLFGGGKDQHVEAEAPAEPVTNSDSAEAEEEDDASLLPPDLD